MEEKKKIKKFDDLIYKHYHEDDYHNFDKINYMYHKTRKIFISDNKNFRDFTAELQFDLCTTSINIVLGCKRSVLNDLSFFRKKDKDKHIRKYDIEFGFEPVEYIEIGNQKLLVI